MPSAPSPGKLIVASLGLTVVIVLSGTVALGASLFGGDDDGTTAAPPPRPSATSSPQPASTSVSPTTTTAPEPDTTLLPALPSDLPTPTSTDPSVDATAYRALPSEPWNTQDIDFGFVTRARFRDGELLLTLNRARFLGGQEAIDANGGEAPPNDYLILDESGRTRTFAVSEDAVLIGTDALGTDEDPVSAEAVTQSQLRTRVTTAVAAGRPVMVWLRHADASDKDSPVTFLQEQYAP